MSEFMDGGEAHSEAQCSTYWGDCSFGESSSFPWTLRWHPAGGHIAIANRAFKAGDLICMERPTTWTKAWHPFTAEQKATIEVEISELSPEKREAFYAMSNAYPDVLPLSAGIYMTNSFEMPSYNDADAGESTESNASGMFLAIGRLNHSCLPNSQQTYIPAVPDATKSSSSSDRVGHEVLYATRDIKAGEELCDCYIELRQTTEQRRKELQKYYQFTCTCPACGPADADGTSTSAAEVTTRKESDLRRKRALKLDHDMIEFVNMGEITMAIDLGIELVKLLEHEKSRGWGERYIAEACVNTSVLMQEERQMKNALVYLEKAHTWNVRLQGPDSADSINTQGKISELKSVMMHRKRP